MPAFPPVVTLKLGSQTLGLAKFESQPQGSLLLSGYCLREIVNDPAAEDDRLRLICEVLPTMVRELDLKPGPVAYAVSGEWVFSRFIKLPAVDEGKIGRMIAFEAQQNIPFPLDQVVWDYQLIGSDSANNMEVLLVAIKGDLLNYLNRAVENAGLRTTLVEVAPMALYNAFRLNYGDLAGCSLIIDIGARTTDLLFVESEKIFTRTIPIGGSSITAAIAKEFGQSFEAAELRKKNQGFVSLGEVDGEADDPEAARVTSLVRDRISRLHTWVARSINLYRMQQEGTQPERVFLNGGTGATLCIKEFFEEKLQRPTEFLNPLRRITPANSIALGEISQAAPLLGELVGLALRSTARCAIELNLRPASVVRREDLAQRQPFLIFAGICFLLGLLAWSFYFGRSMRVLTEVANGLELEIDRMHDVKDQFNRLRRKRTRLDQAATPLLAAVRDREAWTRILDDLNAHLPERDIWITELAPTSNGEIVGEEADGEAVRGLTASAAPATKKQLKIDGLFVRGLYLSNPRQQEVVIDYFRNLLSSTVFQLQPAQQAEVIRPSTPTATEWAYPYELRLKLRQPIALR